MDAQERRVAVLPGGPDVPATNAHRSAQLPPHADGRPAAVALSGTGQAGMYVGKGEPRPRPALHGPGSLRPWGGGLTPPRNFVEADVGASDSGAQCGAVAEGLPSTHVGRRPGAATGAQEGLCVRIVADLTSYVEQPGTPQQG
eukprot:1837596-Lingulodinium_polyedra.AAC.1